MKSHLLCIKLMRQLKQAQRGDGRSVIFILFNNIYEREGVMDIRNIAELIILQCIEDLWNERERYLSAHFFTGEGFPLCAGIAGMDLNDQGRLLNIVRKAVRQNAGAMKSPEHNLPVLQG